MGINLEGLLSIVYLFFFIVAYFLPYVIARRNKHKNKTAIGILNTFFGWTVLGWFAALIWSVAK